MKKQLFKKNPSKPIYLKKQHALPKTQASRKQRRKHKNVRHFSKKTRLSLPFVRNQAPLLGLFFVNHDMGIIGLENTADA